jgi:hypothetical protein
MHNIDYKRLNNVGMAQYQKSFAQGSQDVVIVIEEGKKRSRCR